MSLAVWHLALASGWAAAQTSGEYAVSTLGATVDEVGFIHASYDYEQVGRVAALAYGGVVEPLVLLPLDPYLMADVGITVVSEPGDPTDPAGEWFPHLYGGPIPVAAFMAALPAHMSGGKLVLDQPAADLLRQQMDVREAAYAVVTDDRGRVLLARLSGGIDHRRWTLPGGGLDRDESPEDAVVREVREETGYQVRLVLKLGVDVIIIPSRERASAGDGPVAGVRHIYQAVTTGGALRHEMNGSTDLAGWHGADEIGALSTVELVDVARRLSMPMRGPGPSLTGRWPEKRTSCLSGVSILGTDYPPDPDERQRILDSLGADDTLAALDDRFYQLEASTDADSKLAGSIEAHPEALP